MTLAFYDTSANRIRIIKFPSRTYKLTLVPKSRAAKLPLYVLLGEL